LNFEYNILIIVICLNNQSVLINKNKEIATKDIEGCQYFVSSHFFQSFSQIEANGIEG